MAIARDCGQLRVQGRAREPLGQGAERRRGGVGTPPARADGVASRASPQREQPARFHRRARRAPASTRGAGDEERNSRSNQADDGPHVIPPLQISQDVRRCGPLVTSGAILMGRTGIVFAELEPDPRACCAGGSLHGSGNFSGAGDRRLRGFRHEPDRSERLGPLGKAVAMTRRDRRPLALRHVGA